MLEPLANARGRFLPFRKPSVGEGHGLDRPLLPPRHRHAYGWNRQWGYRWGGAQPSGGGGGGIDPYELQ